MTIDWQPLREIIDAGERFIISSHVRPDADALGSEIGLAGLLLGLGKSVRIVNPSATPAHLSFLDPDHLARKLGDGVKVEEACAADVHIVVDTSSWQQLADVRHVLEKTTAKKVVIDHHVSADDLAAREFKDSTASAAGLLVAEMADAIGLPIGPREAEALFCAIATDTGWFRFPNADSRTLRVAARLIDAGARPHILYQQLYERSSLARLKLHSRVLGRVEVAHERRVGHTYVLLKDFEETGAQPPDTEDLVNDCLTLDGALCAFILVEQRSGQVKASFRSREGLDVAQVAEQFGGGGHKQASGAMIPGPLATVQPRVLAALKAALDAI